MVQMPMSDKTDEELGARVPPGEYLVRVSEAIEKNSKAGNPMIEVGFEILESRTPEVDTADVKGNFDLKTWLVFTPKSEFALRPALRALQIPFKPGDTINVTPGDIFNRRCIVAVELVDGDKAGTKFPKVMAMKPVDGDPGGGKADLPF